MDKTMQIFDDKMIRKTYNASIDEVQKSLELIRGMLDKEASEGDRE